MWQEVERDSKSLQKQQIQLWHAQSSTFVRDQKSHDTFPPWTR